MYLLSIQPTFRNYDKIVSHKIFADTIIPFYIHCQYNKNSICVYRKRYNKIKGKTSNVRGLIGVSSEKTVCM